MQALWWLYQARPEQVFQTQWLVWNLYAGGMNPISTHRAVDFSAWTPFSLNTSAGSPSNFLFLSCQMPETFTATSLKIHFKNEVDVVEWKSDRHYSLMMFPTALLWGNNLVQKDCRMYRASKWHYLHLACLHAIKKKDAPWDISDTNSPETHASPLHRKKDKGRKFSEIYMYYPSLHNV